MAWKSLLDAAARFRSPAEAFVRNCLSSIRLLCMALPGNAACDHARSLTMHSGIQAALIAMGLLPVAPGPVSGFDQLAALPRRVAGGSVSSVHPLPALQGRLQPALQVAPRCQAEDLRCGLDLIAPRSAASLPAPGADAVSTRPETPAQLPLPSPPAADPETIWVPVRQSVTIEELFVQLGVDETRLAPLNNVDEHHRFVRGDWLAVPSRQHDSLTQIVPSLTQIVPVDGGHQRSTPPTGVVHLGDTLLKIAQRYGMSLAELLRLNPGLETARLVVGSQIRLAQSSPVQVAPPVQGMNPVGSGGLSWPAPPDLDELVRDGIVAPAESSRLRLLSPLLDVEAIGSRARLSPDLCSMGVLSRSECTDLSGVTRLALPNRSPLLGLGLLPSSLSRQAQQDLLQRIRAARESVSRIFGACTYRWDGWRLVANGVRITTYSCKESGDAQYTIGVSCASLKVNQFRPSLEAAAGSGGWVWSAWRHPQAGGEEEMVAALCANLLSSR